MDLSFLSPLAFRLLYALPLLFIPYLLRERGTRIVVPALFLYEGLPSAARMRLWGQLRLTPLFFLQLLILLLLIAAAAQPFLRQQGGGKVALVLDTSASMQARAFGRDENMFLIAQRQAMTILDTIPGKDQVALFTSAPLLTPVLAATGERAQARQALAGMTVTDAPDPSDEMLSVFFSQLLDESDFHRVIFVTDRPLATSFDTVVLTVVTVGESQANAGITAFRIYRSPFLPNEIDATVVVTANTHMQNQKGNKEWRVSIENGETRKQLAAQPFTPGQEKTFSFSRLPLATTYRAQLSVEDGLALDNEASAVLPALKNVPILLVSPSANLAANLRQVPNLKVEHVAPQQYTPAAAARAALVLFHLSTPAALPSTNAAFILPPQDNGLFPLGQSTSQLQIAQWITGHPLTAYVTFALLSPSYAHAFAPLAWCKSVINATAGPLLLACEREGNRYAAVGFDVLPYLGKKNLPMSILTLNLLGWLADHAGQPPSLKTGTSLALEGASGNIRAPNGEMVVPAGNTLLLTQQGIYTISSGNSERRVAVNLTDSEESHLRRPLRLSGFAATATVEPQTADRPLWPWLLLVALLLLALEWWLSARAQETVSNT